MRVRVRVWLPSVRQALRSGDEAALRALWTEEARGLYSLRLFTAEFCTLLLEECEHSPLL